MTRRGNAIYAMAKADDGKPRGFGSASGSAGSGRLGGTGDTTKTAAGSFWTKLDVTVEELKGLAKPLKPIIMANKTEVIVWLVGNTIYCTAAAGSAYSFPLLDADIFEGALHCTLLTCNEFIAPDQATCLIESSCGSQLRDVQRCDASLTARATTWRPEACLNGARRRQPR